MKSSPTFEPDLGAIADRVSAIQETCLQSSAARVRPSTDCSSQHSIGLSSLPTELLDHIASYLSASPAVAFKLTCRATHASDPTLSDVLMNPCFDRQEAFLAKCYLESLSSPDRLQLMLCSGCKQPHPLHYFSMQQRLIPAEQRKCHATGGFTFFGKALSAPATSLTDRRSLNGNKPLFMTRGKTNPTPVDGFPSKRRFVRQGSHRSSTQKPQFILQLRTKRSGVSRMEEKEVTPEQAFVALSSAVRNRGLQAGKRRRSRSGKRVKSGEGESSGKTIANWGNACILT